MDIKKSITSMPESPGVYFFKDNRECIIYIGKAVNLRRRVSSYFGRRHYGRTALLVRQIDSVDYLPTATGAEALIYEASLIKKHMPRFNVELKDDKSYPFLKLTVKEKFPRLYITREKERDGSVYYGPYTNVKLLRQALVFMKNIFPLRTCNKLPKRTCLNFDIGQCPGPCAHKEAEAFYRETVRDIRLFLSGRRKALIKRLSAKMKEYSEKTEYEKALRYRKRLEAFSVLLDQTGHAVPLSGELKSLKDALSLKAVPARIEAFDVSNTGGAHSVGSMVTFFNAAPLKDGYRRFKIKTVSGIDDYAMIKELVRRRYSRLIAENKKMPGLILIDGGQGHLAAAAGELDALGVKTPVISIAKQDEEIYVRGRSRPVDIPRRSPALKLIQRIRDEAHRFAISYHKLLRGKGMLGTGKAGKSRRRG